MPPNKNPVNCGGLAERPVASSEEYAGVADSRRGDPLSAEKAKYGFGSVVSSPYRPEYTYILIYPETNHESSTFSSHAGMSPSTCLTRSALQVAEEF